MTLYLDGEIISYNYYMNEPSSYNLKFIGASGHPDGLTGFFKGKISEIRIYKEELIAEDIFGLFNLKN